MKLNCIIVDDDPIFSRIFAKMVKNLSEHLDLKGIAENGQQAENLVENSENGIDIIFLDVNMPDMSGFELLDKIGESDKTKIIMVTGSKDFAVDAFRYGVDDYLVKPIKQERLKEAVIRIKDDLMMTGKETLQSAEDLLLGKVLKYLQSREKKQLLPIPSRKTKMGYLYPMVSFNLDSEHEEKALDILNAAEKEGFFTSEFYDSFYVCNKCFSSFMHFRETCPKCESSDIEVEDVVHHFRCAYVGPISDFFTDGDTSRTMICPKCSKSLKHIGVDYDKPSQIYSCNQCEHTFQDPIIRAKCSDCDANPRVEKLVKKKIKKYFLTSSGRNAVHARERIHLNMYQEALQDIMEESTFLDYLEREIDRKKEVEFESTIAGLNFENFHEILKNLNKEKTVNLIRQLYREIRNSVQPSDEVVFKDRNTVLILYTEKDYKTSASMTLHIKNLVTELIRDNFNDFELEVRASHLTINENFSAEKHLEKLVAPFAIV